MDPPKNIAAEEYQKINMPPFSEIPSRASNPYRWNDFVGTHALTHARINPA
jgi:hypothetical protein